MESQSQAAAEALRPAARRPRSLFREFRLLMRGAPRLSLLIITLAVVCALFAPWISPANPIETTLADTFVKPDIVTRAGTGYILGTDHLGRDLLSRLIYGARVSVQVGFFAVFVSGAIGLMVALVGGYFKGWWDTIGARLTDAFLALPFLMVAVTVISILQPSLMNVVLIIGLLGWPNYARVLRGEVLKVAAMDFVQLAVVGGAGRVRILVRHIFPNIVNRLLVLASLQLGTAIIAEASLSFLGLGVPRPMPSWGTMLAESQKYLWLAWWQPLFPGIAISALVMAFNLTGDWLSARMDPTKRQI